MLDWSEDDDDMSDSDDDAQAVAQSAVRHARTGLCRLIRQLWAMVATTILIVSVSHGVATRLIISEVKSLDAELEARVRVERREDIRDAQGLVRDGLQSITNRMDRDTTRIDRIESKIDRLVERESRK